MNWEGTVTFEGPGAFDTRGTADTWQNFVPEDEDGNDIGVHPTGWAFTNVRSPGASRGLDLGSESGFENVMHVDVLNFADETDFSPGYVTPAVTEFASGVVNAGQSTSFTVPIFSNGGAGYDPEGEAFQPVEVTVREGGPDGDLVVPPTNTAVEPYDHTQFTFEYTPQAEGPFDLYVEVAAVGEVVEGSEANNAQLSTLWAGSPTGESSQPVLVVDDDGYTDGEEAYTGALAALGIPYAVVQNHAAPAVMSQYRNVIWVGAIDRGPGQLDESDRLAITEYLDAGGDLPHNLWLASNRAIGAIEADGAPEFARCYFGAETVETTTLENRHAIRGAGGVFPDSLVVELQSYQIRPFSDLLAAAGDTGGCSTPSEALVLEVANKPGRDGSIFGITAEGITSNFHTVTTPFSLSQAVTPDSWIQVTRSVMAYFGVSEGQYSVDTEEPLVFHPEVRFQVSGRDTPVTAVVLGGDGVTAPVTLFYRVHGTQPFTQLVMTPGAEPGAYSAIIPGAFVTPSGLDYYVKAGANSTFDPAPASLGQLTHAIAVAIPEQAAPPIVVDPSVPEIPVVPELPKKPIANTGGETQLLLVGGLLLIALAVRRGRSKVGA